MRVEISGGVKFLNSTQNWEYAGDVNRGRNELIRCQVRAGDLWGTSDSAIPGWCPDRFSQLSMSDFSMCNYRSLDGDQEKNDEGD
jgi:hypothetical protein